jgi:GGDEF domain-containing protein
MIGLSIRGGSEARQQRQQILDKVTREADAGRRLAIYDRETGLYAHWYHNLRFTEESKRSQRYTRPLSVIVIEVPHSEGFSGRDQMTAYLMNGMRNCDIASHLGDGRYLVYMPETDAEAAQHAAERIRLHAVGTLSGVSIHGDDGEDLATLQAIAEARLDETRPGYRPKASEPIADGIIDLRPFKEGDEPKLSPAL